MPMPIQRRYGNGWQKPDVHDICRLDQIVLRIQRSWQKWWIPEKWVGRSLSGLKIREQYQDQCGWNHSGVQVDVTLDPYEPLPEEAILILIGATSVLEKFHTWK